MDPTTPPAARLRPPLPRAIGDKSARSVSVSARARSRAVSACLSVKPERCTVFKLVPLALNAACTLAKSDRSGVLLGVQRKSMRQKCRFPGASLRWFGCLRLRQQNMEAPRNANCAAFFITAFVRAHGVAADAPRLGANCFGGDPWSPARAAEQWPYSARHLNGGAAGRAVGALRPSRTSRSPPRPSPRWRSSPASGGGGSW